MSSAKLLKSRKYKLNERVRTNNYKLGWNSFSKYSKFIYDHVTLCETNISLSKLNMYNKQFISELKSNNINYRNTKYYRVWQDMYSTLTKHVNSPKHNAYSIMQHSVINLVYISNKEKSHF